MEVTRGTVSRLSIEKQGLNTLHAKVNKEAIFDVVDRLGCIPIDHLTLFSRLGCYDKDLLHELAYRDRRLFEYWAHAACYIPLKDYRYFIPSMDIRKRMMKKYFVRRAKTDPSMIDMVLERVRKEGPLSARDFEHKRKRRSRGWWDWKPAKVALEALYGAGVLMISHRENFQRFYDLSENVLPSWVNIEEPTEEDRVRFLAVRTMNALGLVNAQEIRRYYLPWSINLKHRSDQWQRILEALTEEGEAVRTSLDGERRYRYCLNSDADRIPRLTEDVSQSCRLLTNFDNLLWDRGRIKSLFNFEVKLETYKPKTERKYGYYNMPILYGNRLVGRIVPKMDRKRAKLIIHSLWHEPWFKADERFNDAFSKTLDCFAEFNDAENIEISNDQPKIG